MLHNNIDALPHMIGRARKCKAFVSLVG